MDALLLIATLPRCGKGSKVAYVDDFLNRNDEPVRLGAPKTFILLRHRSGWSNSKYCMKPSTFSESVG